jgi:hypothetical protein
MPEFNRIKAVKTGEETAIFIKTHIGNPTEKDLPFLRPYIVNFLQFVI